MDALYRISSNEIIDIGDAVDWAEMKSGFFDILIDPPFTDGTNCRNNGELRVFGYAKINDNGTVRNAAQGEIDTFAAAELNDMNIREAAAAVSYYKSDARFRRIMTAFSAILVDEINILRAQHSLPDRTLQQLKTAIENRINKDD